MVNINDLKEMLKEKGYKLTPQRRCAIESIVLDKNKHFSVEELFLKVKDSCPEVGLATVYRTVQLFEEIGIITKHNFDDGCYRYELTNPEENHSHHHLICLKCGNVIEVENDLLEELEHQIEEHKEFKIINHHLKFYGYCKNCNNNLIL